MDLRKKLRKYFIMGSQNCKRDPVKILQEAASAGITAFQYREKGAGSLEGDEKLELGLRLREVCSRHDILFFVNDDVELVEPLAADGIHVGQGDLSAEVIRELLPDKIIGLSISNIEELDQSPIPFINYIGAGPIFNTSTKEDAQSPVGIEWIKTLKRKVPQLPIVGIGGITTENAASVIAAGADGVSFISAVTESEHIIKSVTKL